MLQGKRLAFVGGGNMGEALVRGLLAAKLVGPEDLLVSDVREDRLATLRETYGVRTHPDNAEVVRFVLERGRSAGLCRVLPAGARIYRLASARADTPLPGAAERQGVGLPGTRLAAQRHI